MRLEGQPILYTQYSVRRSTDITLTSGYENKRLQTVLLVWISAHELKFTA